MNHLGRALTEYDTPPVKMLFVYNSNAAVTNPDQSRVLRGLEREDLFTVVFDQVMTDTAVYADLVLPATTFLEAYDFAKGYGSISLQLTRPVIEPVGEARTNVDVFGELCQRLDLGRDDDAGNELEMLLRILDELPPGAGDRLKSRPAGDATLRLQPRAVRERFSEYSGRPHRPLPQRAWHRRRRQVCMPFNPIRRHHVFRWR